MFLRSTTTSNASNTSNAEAPVVEAGAPGGGDISMQFKTVPKYRPFDDSSETWTSYFEQFQFFLLCNNVNNSTVKKATLLANVGTATFNLAKAYLAPSNIMSAEVTLEMFCQVVEEHYNETINFMSSTYAFYSHKQSINQPFQNWLMELRTKAQKCGFTESVLRASPLDRALRDAILMGTSDDYVKNAILKKKDPTLAEVIAIAKEGEMVKKEIERMQTLSLSVHDVHPTKNQKPEMKANMTSRKCYSCGYSDHTRDKCKFRKSKCNTCNKIGHISRICQLKVHSIPEPPSDPDCDEIDIITHNIKCYEISNGNDDNNKLIFQNVIINGIPINFEIDTAASRSIIGYDVWKQIGSPEMLKPVPRITAFGENNFVETEGFINASIIYEDVKAVGSFVVTKGNFTPILGIGNIRKLNIDVTKLLKTLPIIHEINSQDYSFSKISELQTRFSNIFETGLGHCNKLKARIVLKDSAKPRIFKPRPIPFARMESTKLELERLQKLKIIEKVSLTDWAAPIVIVPKPDGSVRICGDFKQTINPCMKIDQHPIPNIEEIFSRLNGGEKFTKIDFSDAFLQVELEEDSKMLTTISTPFGFFKYCRMPFGISNAPAIFQGISDQIVAGIPHTAVFLDDILVSGSNAEEHHKNLEEVFTRIKEFGFKCKLSKCEFFKDEIEYLGYLISKKGRRTNPKRITAIAEMPAPRNVKEVEVFMGKINYYSKFIPNFSHLSAPLNQLRKKDVKFCWNDVCKESFSKLKSALCQEPLLVHYDAKLPIILNTDASDLGIGAVILHKFPNGEEHPIAFSSKTLSSAERNYSTIEKEALAIVFAVKKFHQYLSGRSFEILTDHKPLQSIFSPKKGLPQHVSPRLQRFSLVLMHYDFEINYKPGKINYVADALSRLPIKSVEVETKYFNFDTVIHQILENSPIHLEKVAEETEKCPVLKNVRNYVTSNWPKTVENSFQPYYQVRNQLSIDKGVLLLENRSIIPKALQKYVLSVLHSSHCGPVRMKQFARQYCWWPEINADIETISKSCVTCAELANFPPKSLSHWPEPDCVWSRLHADFAGPFLGFKWLVVVDAKSKFAIVKNMQSNTSAASLILRFEDIFNCYGFCDFLVTDNGPPFTSSEVKNYLKSCNIEHLTTAPYHPASNGAAERFVRSFKERMKKLVSEGKNVNTALKMFMRDYNWRNHTSTNKIPAEMMFSRPIKNELSFLNPKYNRNLRGKSKYTLNEPIWVRQRKTEKWIPGIISKTFGSKLYLVSCEDERFRKVHEDQIRAQFPSDKN